MLTDEQVYEAIAQMLVQCEHKQVAYEPVSARGVLIELGYLGADIMQVLQHCADGGFTYCLDHRFSATHFDPNNRDAVNGMVTDYPEQSACYWGPDQLASRLQCLTNVPYQYRNRSRV